MIRIQNSNCFLQILSGKQIYFSYIFSYPVLWFLNQWNNKFFWLAINVCWNRFVYKCFTKGYPSYSGEIDRLQDASGQTANGLNNYVLVNHLEGPGKVVI